MRSPDKVDSIIFKLLPFGASTLNTLRWNR